MWIKKQDAPAFLRNTSGRIRRATVAETKSRVTLFLRRILPSFRRVHTSQTRVSRLYACPAISYLPALIITFFGPLVHASLPFGAIAAFLPPPRAHFHLSAGPHRETLSPFTEAWKMRILLAQEPSWRFVPCRDRYTFYAFSTLRSSRQCWISSAESFVFPAWSAKCQTEKPSLPQDHCLSHRREESTRCANPIARARKNRKYRRKHRAQNSRHQNRGTRERARTSRVKLMRDVYMPSNVSFRRLFRYNDFLLFHLRRQIRVGDFVR